MQEEAEVFTFIIKKVTPNKSERAKIEALSKRLLEKIDHASKEYGVKTKIRLQHFLCTQIILLKLYEITD